MGDSESKAEEFDGNFSSGFSDRPKKPGKDKEDNFVHSAHSKSVLLRVSQIKVWQAVGMLVLLS